MTSDSRGNWPTRGEQAPRMRPNGRWRTASARHGGHCPVIATSSCAKGKVPSGLSCQSSRQPGSPLLTPSRAKLRRTGAACCCRHMATPSAEPRPKRGLTCSDCRTRLTSPGGCRGRRVNMGAGKMTWVCYECLGDRKRKLPPQDEDSDLDDHLGQVDDDVQQQIQMGLVVRTADPTLLGVDGMQDTAQEAVEEEPSRAV